MNQEILELKEKAKAGDNISQYRLAILYIEGKSIQKDVIEGCKWLEFSAKSGNANAQYSLADQYSKGEGVSKNYDAAISWYKKAASKGHPDAMYKMGILMIYAKNNKNSVSEGESFIRDSAIKGNVNAQYELGLIYLRESEHIKSDGEESVRWLKKSADQGHILSINKLGYVYANGTPDKKIKINNDAAIKYWEIAAKAGYPESQYNLAMLYLDKSIKLWEISASKGFNKSKYMINLMKGSNNR